MNLYELAAWIRGVNETNGFDAPTWDTLPLKLMLVVTELNEARDAVRGTGPDPLAEELADTAVRLLDILHAVWAEDWTTRGFTDAEQEALVGNPLFRPVEELLWKPLGYVCMAAESWRYNNRDDTRIAIELALRETFALGCAAGYVMFEQVCRKVRRNMQRGHLHGKARADG